MIMTRTHVESAHSAPELRASKKPASQEAFGIGVERSSWHVLRHRDFRLYFAGSLTSNLGTWLQNTAQVLLVYKLTHSVFAVGTVTCVQFSGSLLLGPYAAVLADRVGSRYLLIGTQFFSAAAAAVLAVLQFSGLLTEDRLILGALAIGLAFTFALPVQTAMVSRLIPEADTEAAMAMNSVSYNAGRALAPVICVAVLTAMGFGWAFALNAISFGIFATALFVVRPRIVGKLPERTRVRDGIRTACSHPRIILLLAMVASVTVADDPVLVLGPALTRRLGVSDVWSGYFLAALGCGAVLGSLMPIKARTASPVSRVSRRAAWSLLCLGVSVTVFAAGVSLVVSMLAAFTAGVAALLFGAATQALLVQQDRQRAASVMALWAIAWAGSKPLASLADGWLASTTHHVWIAGAVLAAPAIILAIFEICLPARYRTKLKINARNLASSRNAAPAAIPYPP
jgi:MFS family permease